MSDIDLAEQCALFFQYSSAHEWDALARLCAPDAVFAQNGHETDLDGMLAMVHGITESGIEYSYSDVRRLAVEGEPAVVEQHRVTMRRGDGVEANIDVCVVLRFDDDGQVVRLDEYADTAAFAPLFA
jgi:ketosteroid isomerase-like protein